MAAAFAACACITGGLLRYTRQKNALDRAECYTRSLEKMAALLTLAAHPLPQLMKECAPPGCSFLSKMAQVLEENGAVAIREAAAKAGSASPLPEHMQEWLMVFLESAALPTDAMRQKKTEQTLAQFQKETEKLRSAFAEKGRLTLRLSLLMGSALFILMC